MFRRVIEKLHLDKYVSPKLILAIDLVISVIVSLFALLLTSALFESFLYETGLILNWVITSFVASLIFFLLLHTHKNIIRHSTLRELWKLGIANMKVIEVKDGYYHLPSNTNVEQDSYQTWTNNLK